MAEKIPFLIIVPHGGINIPEELRGYEKVIPLDIFFESDTGAVPVFCDDNLYIKTVSTGISKLFIDVDREYRMLSPLTEDGVIKTRTSMDREVFKKDYYPDEIAISNILRRYYSPFHEEIRNSIKDKKIKAIIECHTHMAVGPSGSPDRGMPRPLVLTGYTAATKSGIKQTAPLNMAIELAVSISRYLSKEGETVSDIFRVSDTDRKGFIMKYYSTTGLPVINLSISKSLFLDEEFFNPEKMEISRNRLNHIKNLVYNGMSKFYRKYF
jgi:formiminoglutamase